MSVDLEDYFYDLPFSEWTSFNSRIIETTYLLLDLFTKYDIKATFFVVGYLAEKFPGLIKEIHAKGHEIGSHSYYHRDLRTMNKIEFEEDLLKSIHILEQITGKKVLGFRAPYFSIDHNNFWVFDVLRKYVKYDSSVFPVKTPLYGLPKAPKKIYHPAQDDITKEDVKQELIEVPPLTYSISRFNLPIAGGFHFRFFPYFLIKRGFKIFNKLGLPSMFYIHPKDLDPHMPKVKEYGWHYYYGKRNIRKKFEKLLEDFEFTTAKNVLKL